jgi:Secretion system C-terminal sorting domain
MLRQRIIFLFLIVLSWKMTAQSLEWKTAGMPYYANDIRCIYNDTLTNNLYVSGTILATPTTTIQNERICMYDGSTWTAIGGTIGGQVMSVVKYNGDIIVAGYFTTINSIPFFSIARFDGTTWYPMGNFDVEVYKLKVINSDLYALGSFNSVDGIPAKRIAKWNGSVWSDVYGFSADTLDGFLEDVAIYNGNTYLCGNFVNTTLGINHLAVYKGGAWQNVGGGILGGWTDLVKMAVYKNELHLAGSILKPDGNVGHEIQKWNDTIWSEVGAGVKDLTGGYGFATILDMTIHNNELYVAGGFGYAGHVPAKLVAKWDGLKWCGLATKDLFSTSTNPASAIGFYNDTLYLGIGTDTLNGVYTNLVIKYVAGSYVDTCSINFTGIEQLSIENEITLYPNPSTNQITIEFDLSETKNTAIEIKNVLSQTVKTISTNSFIKGNNKIEVDVREFSNGIYFVQVTSAETAISTKFIKCN